MEKRNQKRFEKEKTVRSGRSRACTAFGVGHESNHIARPVGDPCDVVNGAVRIGKIAEHDLPVLFQFPEFVLLQEVVAFLVRDGQRKAGSFRKQCRKGGSGALDEQGGFFADKAPGRIYQKSARKQPCFGKDLKPVANPEDRLSFFGKGPDGPDDWSLCRDGSRSQVVPVGKPSGQNDRVEIRQYRGSMGNPNRFEPGNVLHSLEGVCIAVCARETDDTDSEGGASKWNGCG